MKFENEASCAPRKMSPGLLAGVFLAALSMTVAQTALAETTPQWGRDDSAGAGEAPAAEDPDAPKKVPGHVGFQMAIGSGYAFPLGDVDSSLTQEEFISGQVPLLLDIGFKVTPTFYIGLYTGVGFGGAGSMLDDVCTSPGVDCSSSTIRMGINTQYHFLPDERWNPYIGYGVGYEVATLSATGPGGEANLTTTGLEFARLALGIDYRASSVIGFGPYVDLGAGAYSSMSDGTSTLDLNVGIHGWLHFGVRMTLLP